MGVLALLATWGLYRYTDLLAHVPFARGLDWCADKLAGLVLQPWARGMTGAVIIAGAPAIVCGLLMGLGFFISWPISVAILLLCMGPQRLFELPAFDGPSEPSNDKNVSWSMPMGADRYHQIAARDVVGCLFWAAILGAPGAVFYRALRELAESPVESLKSELELIAKARLLFGLMYWAPARLYAVAQVASGSGGKLVNVMTINTEIEQSDQLLNVAYVDGRAAVERGPVALLHVVLFISAVMVFLKF